MTKELNAPLRFGFRPQHPYETATDYLVALHRFLAVQRYFVLKTKETEAKQTAGK